MIEGHRVLGGGFPRDIAESAPLSLPLSFSRVPNLTTRKVEDAMRRITGRSSPGVPERRLRGCLVAHRGHGIVFVGEDDVSAMRFVAAHEVAHFVGHYLHRREIAVARLGRTILEVLDGTRDATPAERMGGILAQCPLGVFTDVMERRDGQALSVEVEAMEYEADDAAFQALAPVEEVMLSLGESVSDASRSDVVLRLVEVFGLAQGDAERHAHRISAAIARGRPSLVEALRIAAMEAFGPRRGSERGRPA